MKEMKVLGYVIVGVCGVILGLVAGYYFIVWQIDRMEIKTPQKAVKAYSLDLEEACLSGGLECDGMSLYVPTLSVGDYYGKQRTANVSVLEPKASDAYLQWGDNPMHTFNPQQAGRNE